MNSEKYTLKQAKTAKRIIKYFAKFQASIFLMSKGKLWNKWPGGFPIMVVETKGAKTNKIRNIPLIYVHQDDMPILVASLGGMPKNPNWYYNVKTYPEVKISTINGSGNFLAEEVSKEKKR
jgi:deazaflavin-dependent oxidoreductase (nitroreductase family)